MDKLPASAGIYAIVNMATGERYIGGTTNIRQRWHTHRSKLLKNQSTHTKLQSAWSQWGEEAFRVIVLEYVDNKDDLITREQFYLDTYRPEYNTRLSADNSIAIPLSSESRERVNQKIRGRQFTAEHKEKIRQALTGQTRTPEQRAHIKAGKANVSDETRQKLSAAKKGRALPAEILQAAAQANRGKKRSPEVVEKIRAAQRARWAKRKTQKPDQ